MTGTRIDRAADTGILDWLSAPSPTRGLSFLGDDGRWRSWSYEALAARAAGTADQLIAGGLTAGGVAVVLHQTGPQFVSSFFGALAAGGTPSPLARPGAFRRADDWVGHTARTIRAAGATVFVVDPDLEELALEAAGASGTGCRVVAPDERAGQFTDVRPAGMAVLQFTSGSRGATRGVRVSHQNLRANLAMLRHWMPIEAGDNGVSWLPLYHDMGLVGALLLPVVYQFDQALMRPEQFVGSPLRYLVEVSQRRSTAFAMPNFGFDHVLRRVDAAQLSGLDFSSVQAIVTGAERVRPGTLQSFFDLLGPHGLRMQSVQPAYGLAEATLAVTGGVFGEVPTALAVASGPIRLGQRVPVTATVSLTEVDTAAQQGSDGEPSVWHVSCGRPLPGLSVDVVDDLGEPLPEDHVGEIAVAGPSVAIGYTEADRGESTRFEGGRLLTGDAGLLHRGELYVLGRIGDSLQVRGRNLYVEDIEQALAEQGLLAWQRSVVLAGLLDDAPTLYLVTETTLLVTAAELAAAASRLAGPEVAVRVVHAPRRTIRFTSSGKPRRRVMWQQVLAGELPGQVLTRLDPAEERPVRGAVP